MLVLARRAAAGVVRDANPKCKILDTRPGAGVGQLQFSMQILTRRRAARVGLL